MHQNRSRLNFDHIRKIFPIGNSVKKLENLEIRKADFFFLLLFFVFVLVVLSLCFSARRETQHGIVGAFVRQTEILS